MSKESWDRLAKADDLRVENLTGLFEDSVLICPVNEEFTLPNTYMVSKDDIYAVEEKTTPSTEGEEKTYTKNDIRVAGALAMADIENEDDAVVAAVAIAKLITKLY
jgi:hypothetical protein